MMKKIKMEILLFVLAMSMLILGAWLEASSSKLEREILRLHVLANSDSLEDQELKIEVRDRILKETEKILDGVENRDEAKERLLESVVQLSEAGEEAVTQAGYDYPVKVSVEKSWFPTKQYRDFALPAGKYTALRVVVGEGEGKNWWCVVFPPLCLGGASEKVEITAAMAGLSDGEISLITGESGGYIVKFKLMEIWGQLKRRFG